MKPQALIGCERSGVWARAFVEQGFDVTACDTGDPLEKPDGWAYYQADVRQFDPATFDVGVFFPPCTNTSTAGAHLWKRKDVYGNLALVTWCGWAATSVKACGLVENPWGLAWRVLDRTITVHPWQFADGPDQNALKRTGLFLHRWPMPLFTYAGSIRPRKFVEHVTSGSFCRSRGWAGMARAFALTAASRWRMLHPE